MYVLLYFVMFFSTLSTKISWGFSAHKSIARHSIEILPQEMGTFFKKNIDYIETHTVDPDKRRYLIKNEAPRHYMDLEFYKNNKETILEVLCMNWEEAKKKFSSDSLYKHGILIWQLNKDFWRLVKAMKKKDKKSILKITADFIHYISDGHVPLHTTENYDGQLTNQHGLHGLWETQIVENWNTSFYTSLIFDKPVLITDIKSFFADIIIESHQKLDVVFYEHKVLMEESKGKIPFVYRKKGKKYIKKYSDSFLSLYEKRMNDMTKKRWQKNVQNCSSILFTAWQYAGKVNLDAL